MGVHWSCTIGIARRDDLGQDRRIGCKWIYPYDFLDNFYYDPGKEGYLNRKDASLQTPYRQKKIEAS